MTNRAESASRVCRRCGRVGHAAFRLVDRLPSGTQIWECSVKNACGRKRLQLLGAPSGRGRSPSMTAASSTLPPMIVLVSGDAALRDLLASALRHRRAAALRTMTVAQAARSVTWVVSRTPDVLVIDGRDLRMAERNSLARASRAAATAGCRIIVVVAQPDDRECWASDATTVLVHEAGAAAFDAALSGSVVTALRSRATRRGACSHH